MALHCFAAAFFLAVSPLAAWAQQAEEKVYQTPYFPLKLGHRWVYKAGDQAVLLRVDKQEKFETKKGEPEKTEIVLGYRLEAHTGSLQDLLDFDPAKSNKSFRQLAENVAVLDHGVFRFSAGGKDITPPLCFLKLPIKTGETWEVNSSSDGVPLKGSFICKAESVTVQAGTYDKALVSAGSLQMGNKTMQVTYWLAPNVGMVKQYVKVGDLEVTLELKEFLPAK